MLTRVTLTLLGLTVCAPIAAVDTVHIRNPRASQDLTIAYDELHIDGDTARVGKTVGVKSVTLTTKRSESNAKVQLHTKDRASLHALAKGLVADGVAQVVNPVLYVKGLEGRPEGRVIVTRQIFFQVYPGQDPLAVARDNRVVITQRATMMVDGYFAEPLDASVLAPLDATRRLASDARIMTVEPQVIRTVSPYYVPNDPVLPYQTVPAGGHLLRINVAEVWDEYKGEGTNTNILDEGTETTHPDLGPNIRWSPSGTRTMSWDFFTNTNNPNPAVGADENHGTFVSGCAAARGDNGIGICGVSFLSGIIAARILNTASIDPYATIPTDAVMYTAFTLAMSASSPSDLAWVSNNSWGPSSASYTGGPGPLSFQAFIDATRIGRLNHGVNFFFAAGNSGTNNPNDAQDCVAFDGYRNRLTVGVASSTYNPTTLRWEKATYSETGPNLMVIAPGGGGQGLGHVSTDRTGDLGYIPTSNTFAPAPYRSPSDFDGDPVTVLPWENGDYTPTNASMGGTSFASPTVAGAANLPLQSRPSLTWRDLQHLLMSRGNDRRTLPQFNPQGRPHDAWGVWRQNTITGRFYCNWFGFGELDVGRLVYGGDGTRANMTAAIGLANPGAKSWPLLPAEYATVITATSSFSPIRAPDALDNSPGNPDLVAPPLVTDVYAPIVVIAGSTPSRFRIESVEATISLYGNVAAPGGGGNHGDLAFWLISPSGNVSILGRQRPGSGISNDPTSPWTWTFTERYHADETLVDGIWQFQVRDERYNGLEVYIKSASIAIRGYQTYEVPNVASSTPAGAPNSGSSVSLSLSSTGTGVSAAGNVMTTAFWDDGTGIGNAIPLSMSYSGGILSASVPASAMTPLPNCAYLHLGNPAMVVGYTGTNDVFDTDGVATLTTVPNPVSGGNPNAYFKVGTTPIIVKYSRPPVISTVLDQGISAGDIYNPTFTVRDADQDAGLGGPPALPGGAPGSGAAESVVVTATSLNQSVVPNSGLLLTGTYPNYSLIVASSSNGGGVGLVRISATDGSVTTTQTFRVIIKGTAKATSCGTGLGLALIGLPLAAWLVGRRRRRAA